MRFAMSVHVQKAFAPKRKQETQSSSHRAFCPATGAIEWFRNREVFRCFLWLTSRRDVAHVQPNAYSIKERFGTERLFSFEFRIRHWDSSDELIAVRRTADLSPDNDGILVPPHWARASRHCKHNGLRHRFITEDDLVLYKQRIDNWQRVLPYLQLAQQVPDSALTEKICKRVRSHVSLSLADLVGSLPRYSPQEIIAQTFDQLWRGQLAADMDSTGWSVQTLISEEESSGQYEVKSLPTESASFDEVSKPEPEDPDTWDAIPAGSIADENARRGYEKRRSIIWDRLKRGNTIGAVAKTHDCSTSWVTRVVGRCQRLKPNGEPWGWEGAIPNVKWPWPSERDANSYREQAHDPASLGHALSRFFQHYPDIKTAVISTALIKKKKGTRSGRRCISAKKVWKTFLKECRAKGIPAHHWPFNTADVGREAIRRFVRGLEDSHTRKYIEVNIGKDGLVVYEATQPNRAIEAVVRPYSVLQVDGHDSNAYSAILLPDTTGLPCVLPLGRFWLILCVDVGSRAALGYTITPETNYASVDLLDSIFAALTPWKRYPGVLPDSSYRTGAGMPSGVFPFCAWRGFDMICLDNALAHLSRDCQERIVETTGAVVNTGIPGKQTTRAIVERFFASFESEFGHGPSSTGSNPRDPRREDPVGAAIRHGIDLFMLEGVADAIIANHNTTPHTTLNGRTPLQYLSDWHQRDPLLARYVPDSIQDDLPLYYRTFKATIARNVKQGGACYIQWLYSRHTNDCLAATPSLKGTKVLLVVDSRDARQVWAYTHRGEPLGKLYPQDRWALRAHSLRERRIIGVFRNARLIDTDTTDPVGDLHEIIDQQARVRPDARRKLAVRQREERRYPRNVPADKTTSSTPDGSLPRDWVPITGHFYSKRRTR